MSDKKTPSSVNQQPVSSDQAEGETYVIGDSVDIAAAYANQFNGENAYSRKEEVRLRWKLDTRLVPILWFNITLSAMDKVTTATAALYGLRKDTGLVGDEYAWVGSAFYFGYLLWCFPSAGMLQKLPIAKTMAVVQIIWGFVLIGTGFAKNFKTLIVLRVLLGILEAPILPGNFLVVAMWYSRSEQPIRTGLMYTGLSVLFTGPIGYAIGFIPGHSQWRWFFWITGIVSIVWAVLVGILLPDNPVKAKFVTEREKAIVVEKIRGDQTGMENKHIKSEQIWECFLDPKTWLIFAFQLTISIPNGGLTNFAPLIINGLGYSPQRSTLITMPTGIMQTVSSYLCNGAVFLCAKYLVGKQLRGVICIVGCLVGMIAAIFLYTLPLTNLHGRLAALYMAYFYLGPYIVSIAMSNANTAGHTKKVFTNALIFIAYCVSNIIAPHFFMLNQAPLYALGMGAILGSYVLSIIIISLYCVYCWSENRRRDKLDAAAGSRVHEDTDFKDLTDKQNIHFRYVW